MRHQDQAAANRRAWERMFIKVDDPDNYCFVRNQHGACAKARVLDVSLSGARVEFLQPVTDDVMPPLEAVGPSDELYFSQCEVKGWGEHLCGAGGSVRWAKWPEAGCLFHSPIAMRK